MTVLTVASALGVPSVFAIVCSLIKLFKNQKTMMKALQGMMRADLIRDYRYYIAKGEIDDLELFDWSKRYEAYHNLGQNGVLDAYNNDVIELSKRIH